MLCAVYSLGGALATLLAYKLAGSDTFDTLKIPFPLQCVSYAALYVGDHNFQKVFQQLEQMGRLQHVRVTNENDVVPVSPPHNGYTHTGVNLHLLNDEGCFEIGYRNTKSFLSQLNPFSSLGHHSLMDYFQRGLTIEAAYIEMLERGENGALHITSLYRHPDIVKALEDSASNNRWNPPKGCYSFGSGDV